MTQINLTISPYAIYEKYASHGKPYKMYFSTKSSLLGCEI